MPAFQPASASPRDDLVQTIKDFIAHERQYREQERQYREQEWLDKEEASRRQKFEDTYVELAEGMMPFCCVYGEVILELASRSGGVLHYEQYTSEPRSLGIALQRKNQVFLSFQAAGLPLSQEPAEWIAAAIAKLKAVTQTAQESKENTVDIAEMQALMNDVCGSVGVRYFAANNRTGGLTGWQEGFKFPATNAVHHEAFNPDGVVVEEVLGIHIVSGRPLPLAC